MRQKYEEFREEVKEIENIFKKKMTEDLDVTHEDPELILLLLRCAKLLKASDEFTLACIKNVEEQNEKLDLILAKLEEIKGL